MQLPIMPPVLPMLAKAVKEMPSTADFSFEPKWDGFRCLVFKDGDEVELASRNAKSLTKYFPEVVAALKTNLPNRCVLDGELFVAQNDRLQFEMLQERIHPALSRINLLAENTPAGFVAFDILALADADLTELPFSERRLALTTALTAVSPPIYLTKTTTDPKVAAEWFQKFEGAGLDGVIAKPLAASYQSNVRAMLKIKHARTADVVLCGYRLHKTSTPEKPLLGSMLLGLYNTEGVLNHIGVAASFTASRRTELIDELAELVTDIAVHPWGAWMVANPDRVQGTQSRWSQGKDLSFIPLKPVRVLEVGYDHMEGHRFRHTAQFKRWRPDREPRSCDYTQLEEPATYQLAEVFQH